MWKYEDIDEINIEISSLCNSICAWCPRYENMSTVVNKQLTPQYISIDTFKEWFPPELVSRIKHWTYSGDYGDAGTNPDLVEIFKYTFEYAPNAGVRVHTNGGMKNPKFWSALGKLFSLNENRLVVFSIDGLADTNHIYRRNVNWQKVMDNSAAYISKGGRAEWDFLTFKHNEHQIDDVISLANEMGFSNTHIKYPKGFEKGSMKVRDSEMNVLYEIEPVSEEHIQDSYPELNGLKAEDIPYEHFGNEMESHFSDVDGEINCFSMRSGTEVRITSDGIVYPCAHFGHLSKHPRENQAILKSQMLHIFKDKKLSLHDRSLKDILEDDPFNWVYNSWDKKSCLTCWGNCGSSKDKKTIMQQIYQKDGKIHGTI